MACLGLAARDRVYASAKDFREDSGSRERDRDSEHPERVHLETETRYDKEEAIDEQQARNAAEEIRDYTANR